jgi:hypothetical protein
MNAFFVLTLSTVLLGFTWLIFYHSALQRAAKLEFGSAQNVTGGSRSYASVAYTVILFVVYKVVGVGFMFGAYQFWLNLSSFRSVSFLAESLANVHALLLADHLIFGGLMVLGVLKVLGGIFYLLLSSAMLLLYTMFSTLLVFGSNAAIAAVLLSISENIKERELRRLTYAILILSVFSFTLLAYEFWIAGLIFTFMSGHLVFWLLALFRRNPKDV